MATVSAFTAKRLFVQLLQRVERGEEIVITLGGKAVARLVPTAASPDKAGAEAAFRRLRDGGTLRSRKVRLGGVASLS